MNNSILLVRLIALSHSLFMLIEISLALYNSVVYVGIIDFKVIVYNILLGFIFIISSYAIWSRKVWGWYFASAFYIKTILTIVLLPTPFIFRYTIESFAYTFISIIFLIPLFSKITVSYFRFNITRYKLFVFAILLAITWFLIDLFLNNLLFLT